LNYGPDALGVALVFGGVGAKDELAALLRARRQAVANLLEGLTTKRTYLESRGFLSPANVAVLRRAEMHLEAELRWHDEFGPILIEAAEPTQAAASKKSSRRRREKDAHDRS